MSKKTIGRGRKMLYNGQYYNVRELLELPEAKRSGVSYYALCERTRLGEPIETAITRPLRKRRWNSQNTNTLLANWDKSNKEIAALIGDGFTADAVCSRKRALRELSKEAL